MGIRKLIADIRRDPDKYFKEKDPYCAEEFLGAYCCVQDYVSDDRLDRNFYGYFKYWVPYWLEKNAKTFHYQKEEFADYLELCDLCIQDYDAGGSLIFHPWGRKISKDEFKRFLRKLLLDEIKTRPGMYVRDFRLDILYYDLLGHCFAHHEAGMPYEEIEATFCEEFGEWLQQWIRENVDGNYTVQTQYWYEDIRRILPEGKEELNYFLELCELFFADYDTKRKDALFSYIDENIDSPTLDYSAYINKKCITPKMLEDFIYEYSATLASLERLNKSVIQYSGLSDNDDIYIFFHHSEGRMPSHFRHSAILEKDFHYAQYITVSMPREVYGRGYDKSIMEFFFFIKTKIACDMLITDPSDELCFISGNDITWSLDRSCLLSIANPHWRDSREEKYSIGTVRAVNLFTVDETELEDIYLQWKEEMQICFEPDSMKANFQEEAIYAVCCGAVKEYDEKRLQKVNSPALYRYTLHYANRETMKYFIERTKFSKGSYLENGRGKMLSVEEVRKDILDFID